MNRYARQMILPEIGVDGQNRLAQAHVLIVGAGGLGCPVLQYLAGAGVGHITLLDPDHVEESNLHRQPLYRMADVGCPKAQAARDHLLAANPALNLTAQVGALHPGNAQALVRAADAVVDAADSFAVSYTLSDTCTAAQVPLVTASALGLSGYAGAFCAGAPSLRAVFPDLPSRGATCATAGVMGPVVGMIGALQAQIVLQILLDLTPSPLGRMTTLDAASLRFGGFDFNGAPEPERNIPFVSRSALTSEDYVVELRGQQEAPALLAPHARRWGIDALSAFDAAPEQRIVLCCATGLRAWRAAGILEAQGFENLALLAACSCA